MNLKTFVKNIIPFKISRKSDDLERLFLSLTGIGSLNWSEVRAGMAWSYYKKVSPIFRAVNLVCNEFANGIEPVLWDKQNEEYIRQYDPRIKESEVLKLLEKPNFLDSASEFRKSVSTSLVVTGDSFVVITGLNEPLEIFFENPKYVMYVPENDGYPKSITVSKSSYTEVYTRQEIDGEYRYISSSGLSEIVHIKEFNPDFSVGTYNGFSRLSPVYYELEQYLASHVHNLSQLKKGARPSGALMYDGDLTEPEQQALRAELQRFYQGEGNSGELMILTGGVKKEFKELSINNKDMDFVELKRIAKDSIYENMEIPASFYDNSASTMNNKDVDKLNLYDFNVIPMTRKIYDTIGYALLRRYKNGSRYVLDFIEEETPALKSRYIEQIKDMRSSGAFTINEIRSMYGRESIGEEGDVIYQPMSLFPIGMDKFTRDNLDKPLKKTVNVEAVRKELKSRGFSNKDIEDIVKWHF